MWDYSTSNSFPAGALFAVVGPGRHSAFRLGASASLAKQSGLVARAGSGVERGTLSVLAPALRDLTATIAVDLRSGAPGGGIFWLVTAILPVWIRPD